MEAGKERDVLVEIADRLCESLGYAGDGGLAVEARVQGLGGVLDGEDQELVAAFRQSLTRIAAALGAGAEGPAATAVEALLGGVELVLRRELAMGNPPRLKEFFPSAVYLVSLPLVEYEQAQELADRTSTLLDEFLSDP